MASLELFILFHLALFHICFGSVTIYRIPGWQYPLTSVTPTGDGAINYTGMPAFNPSQLRPPPPPRKDDLPTKFSLNLSHAVPRDASIEQGGSFAGFSVEMSVVNQVFGTNSSLLQVPFLNLMANIQQRAGSVAIRVGGNSQETAVLVDRTSDGQILEKDLSGTSNPTQTPYLTYTPELLWMLRNISSLVNVRWHLGIPFNDTSNFRLAIAEQGQAILGDYLIGLQAGNEPDLYGPHGHRPPSYSPRDYFDEFGKLVQALSGDQHVINKNLLVAPNINPSGWTPEMVWNTEFVDYYSQNLAYLAFEHYPSDNCYAQYGSGIPRDPQEMFPTYLNHSTGKNIAAYYLNSTAYAQGKRKKMLMFETNTASCGGFLGVSDSFGAALWGLDYGMQLAYANFSGILFHVGGHRAYYNPFTPPPTSENSFKQWTIGPIYYSVLTIAEALGQSNTTQVVDMGANDNNIYTPVYAIYEHGTLARVLLFNYVTDPSGGSDLNIDLNFEGTGVRSSGIQVKYLSAASTAQKGNITWGGQTFGGMFSSDGRLMGSSKIASIPCSPSTQICHIIVPAPSAALVFLYSPSVDNGTAPTVAQKTFATTRSTRTRNTATVDFAVMATSNGENGQSRRLGSTSEGVKKVHGGVSKNMEKFRQAQVVMVIWVLGPVLILFFCLKSWSWFSGWCTTGKH